jgi:parallel beta-helix repeat protein
MNRRDFTKVAAALAMKISWRTRDGSDTRLRFLNGTDRFDVRDFGALGDGVTDDGVAFQKALDRAARNGGIVTVPVGRFVVRKMLKLRDGVTIEGVGSASVIEHVDGDPVVLAFSGARAVSARDLQIRGRFAFGVVIDRSTAAVVRNCVISGGTVQWSPTAFCGGIFSMYSNDVRLEENTLSGNGLIRQGVLSSDIQVNGFGSKTVSRSIHITGNRCRSTSTQYCIGAYDMQYSEVNANICRGAKTGPNNNNGYGIMIYETPASPGSCLENTLANNQISETGGSGIYLVKSDHSRVIGNTIDGVASVQADDTLPAAGIALNQSQYVVIQENRITRSGRAGISIASNREGIGHVEITHNTIAHSRGMGIHLRGSLTDIRVSRNTVTDTHGGIGTETPDPQSQIVIDDNAVSATTSSAPGIILGNAARSTVTNNRVTDSGGYGLALSLSDDESEVKGNIVVRSGRASPGKYQDIRLIRRQKPETADHPKG